MNDLTDQQLLRDYAERQSEIAFAEIVRRRVDLVYSAALRDGVMTGSVLTIDTSFWSDVNLPDGKGVED